MNHLRFKEVWVKGFAVDHKKSIAVALIPKAGSQSIQVTLGSECFSHEYVKVNCNTRMAFIRDPVERAVSTFKYFKLLKLNDKTDISPKALASFKHWSEYITLNDDDHWKPQADLIGDACNELHRFEDMEKVWYTKFGRLLPMLNRAIEPTKIIREVGPLEEYYAKDFELRAQLHG